MPGIPCPDPSDTIVEVLKTDSRVGLTRATIALKAPPGSQKRMRNQREARKAYDTVTHHMNRLSLTKADAQELQESVAELRLALEQLGERIEPAL